MTTKTTTTIKTDQGTKTILAIEDTNNGHIVIVSKTSKKIRVRRCGSQSVMERIAYYANGMHYAKCDGLMMMADRADSENEVHMLAGEYNILTIADLHTIAYQIADSFHELGGLDSGILSWYQISVLRGYAVMVGMVTDLSMTADEMASIAYEQLAGEVEQDEAEAAAEQAAWDAAEQADADEYIVSYKMKADYPSCTSIVIAESIEDVNHRYGSCYWMSVTPASEYPVSTEELKHRGCPVVVCEHIDHQDDAEQQDIIETIESSIEDQWTARLWGTCVQLALAYGDLSRMAADQSTLDALMYDIEEAVAKVVLRIHTIPATCPEIARELVACVAELTEQPTDETTEQTEQPTMGELCDSPTDILDLLGMGWDEYNEATEDVRDAIRDIWDELVVFDVEGTCFRMNDDIDQDETNAIIARYADRIWDEQGNVRTDESAAA